MIATMPECTADFDVALLQSLQVDVEQLRDEAQESHYPRNKIYRLLADLAEVDAAIAAGATRELRRKRHTILDHIDRERDRAGDTLLSILALALDRRRAELLDLLTPILRDILAEVWRDHDSRIAALEAAVLNLAEYRR